MIAFDRVLAGLGLHERVRLGCCCRLLSSAVFGRESLWHSLSFAEAPPDVAARVTDEALARLLGRVGAGERFSSAVPPPVLSPILTKLTKAAMT